MSISVPLAGEWPPGIAGSFNSEETQSCGECAKKRIYQLVTTALSVAGTLPFYRVAASFGKTLGSRIGVPGEVLGPVAGVSEVASYILFRISNFEQMQQILSNKSSCDWKKVGSIGMGILAQFPIMVLVYYNNGENLIYPAVAGLCEAVFTSLSVLSLGSPDSVEECKEREDLVTQAEAFLTKLPSNYQDAAFVNKLGQVENEEQLWQLISHTERVPQEERGSWDPLLNRAAGAFGALMGAYLIALVGAVSYRGLKEWKDIEWLAIVGTCMICICNKLLITLCIDSAKGYYNTLRDLVQGHSQLPLSRAIGPNLWLAARTLACFLSWMSFGTTGSATAEKYIPNEMAGRVLSWGAPIASTLQLFNVLNGIADNYLLKGAAVLDSTAKRFKLADQRVRTFKAWAETAPAADIQAFLAKATNEEGIVLLTARKEAIQ